MSITSTDPKVRIADEAGTNIADVNAEGQLHTVLRGKIDTGNSTEVNLLADGVFTGTAIDTLDYSSVSIVVHTDVASATDGMVVQYSSDGSHWHDGEVYTVEAGATKFFTPTMQDKYMRIVYTNGGSDQTDFHIHTTLRKSPIKWSSHRIQDDLKDEDDGELNISVLKLRTAADNYVSGTATSNGNFKVSLEELESGISTNSNSQLKVTHYLSNGNEGIAAADSASIDAFGRWRTSSTGQLFDVEFIYDKQPALMDEVTSGGATITHNATSRDVTLDIVNATNGTSALFSQHWHNPYIPGNSQLIDITGTLNPEGIAGGTASIFLKDGITSTETEIVQTNWNTNTVSDVDWSKSQIFMIDFQSLKIGRLRYYLVRKGLPIKVHEITNDNIRSGGYWQYPQQPLAWRIYNDATYTYMEIGYFNGSNGCGFRYKVPVNANATMRAICGTCKTEGGKDLFNISGFRYGIDNGTTKKTVATTLIPLLSIRPRTTFNSLNNHAITIPDSYVVQTDNPIRLVVIENGSLTGASFGNVDTNNSHVEYDTSATAISGGKILLSEYVGAGAKNSTVSGEGLIGKAVLAYGSDGVQDVLTLCAVRTTTTNADVLTGLSWREIR